jgi:lipopolysaccharide transport system ATP-binding protein
MKRSEIESKYDDIVDFAGIGRFIDIPVKWYSSGMYVRLAFAVAAHLEPEILLVDEVLAVGDLAFQRKCLGRIDEIANSGRTILFVSHNLASVASLCTTAFLLEGGRVTDRGDVSRIIQRYVASSREEMTTSTADRTDRRGTGTLHFTAAEVGTANAVMMGEEVEIRLSYTAPAPIRDVMVGIAAYGALGEALFVCSTRIAGNEVASAPSMGTFACTVPRFPLLPGTYYLNVYAEVQGEVADWLENACAFEVFESDFFGSGQLPPTTHGHFAVDHSWSVVDAAVEEAVG